MPISSVHFHFAWFQFPCSIACNFFKRSDRLGGGTRLLVACAVSACVGFVTVSVVSFGSSTVFSTNGTLAGGISGLACCTLTCLRGVLVNGSFIFNPLCVYLWSFDVCDDVDVRLARCLCLTFIFSFQHYSVSDLQCVFLVLCPLSWYFLHFSF